MDLTVTTMPMLEALRQEAFHVAPCIVLPSSKRRWAGGRGGVVIVLEPLQ